MGRKIFTILLFWVWIGAAFASQIIYDEVATFGGVYNDVTADGNYTYVASKNGLVIFNSSDKSDIKKIGKMDTTNELKQIAYKDNYLYISNEDRTLSIVDVSNPSNPNIYADIKTSGDLMDFTIDGGTLYIAMADKGLEILKIDGTISLESVIDTNGTAFAVAASGDYAYVMNQYKGMQIINVSSKTNPTLMGFYPYTSPVGNLAVKDNYVYFADGFNGIEIVDVSDKNAPKHYKTIDIGSYVYDVKIKDDYLYAASGVGGVKIYNISDPGNPYPMGNFDTDGSARGIYTDGDYIYLADYTGGLKIIDISFNGSVYHPVLSDSYKVLAAVDSVKVDGNYLYALDKNIGLKIFDISNENNITEIGAIDTTGDAKDVYIDGNYAYIADGKDGLKIVDISDKTSPVLKGNVNLPDSAEALSVKVKNGMAYVVAGDRGVFMVDVSVPTYPTLKGSYNTEGSARDIFIDGDYAYVADGMAGIKVLSINDDSFSLVSTIDTDGYAMGIEILGDYAYIADGGSGLEIVNVKDPLHPIFVGNNDVDADSYRQVTVSGYNVFAADDSDGLDVLDISDPFHPMYAGTYQTKSLTYDVAVKNPLTFVASGSGGLRIIKIKVMPAAPTNLKLTVKDSRTIELIWSDNSNNETGFKIFRNGVLIKTLPANTTTYTDTGLIPGMTYTYEVKSTNEIGDSLPATATATTEGEPPSAPTNFKAYSLGSKSIKLLWNDNSNNETGFKIFRDNVLIATVPANTTSYIDTGLSKGKTYYYELRATNDKGDSDAVSAEAMPIDPKIELFVKRLYEKILNRPTPDPDGKKYWTEKLQNGATATSVAKSFFNSKEFVEANLDDTEFITRAYQTLLNRDPEPEGLIYWLKQMRVAGLNRNQVFYGFALSKEFTALCQESYGILAYDAADQREAFVERFYNLVLGRDADVGGVKYWTGELKSKRKTAADIANGFFFSDEFKSKAVGNDKFVEIAYRTLLNREADNDGKNYWVGKLNSGYSRASLILDFVYTPEFEKLAKKYDIKAHD